MSATATFVTQPAAPQAGLLDRLSELAAAWRRREADRQAVALLTDRDFRDLGVSRSDIEFELAKPFWRH
jgi:uncharacterized protein YjiS (DUF1127 family)